LGAKLHQETNEDGFCAKSVEPASLCFGDRVGESCFRIGELTRKEERFTQIGQELEPRSIVLLEQCDRPGEQIRCGGRVTALERAPARRREAACCVGAER
jgi:hypothetical protein